MKSRRKGPRQGHQQISNKHGGADRKTILTGATKRKLPKNGSSKGKRRPIRLKLVVGKPWPKAVEVMARPNDIRGGVLFGLVCLCAGLLLTFAAYAIVREDQHTVGEILGLVKMLLSAIGGWAIGRHRG